MSNQEKDPESHYSKSNENITVAVEKHPNCQVKLNIKATPRAAEAAYHKVLKNVSKEVNVPGFRKGRAPANMIVERYQDIIEKEFIDLVLQTSFSEAVNLVQLHPLKEGKIKRPIIHYCSREKGADLTVEFESHPVIPEVKLEELEITRVPRPPITDQERANAIYGLQLRLASFDPIEDRPAQEDDFVNLTLTLLGEHPKDVVQNQQAQVNAMGLPSWLQKTVIGLKAGESVEGVSEQDANTVGETPEFQPTPFRVTVHSISKGNLPQVDDELAKKVGVENLEELNRQLEERLSQEIENECFKEEYKEIQKRLFEKYPFDLPNSYIEAEKKERLEDILSRMSRENQNVNKESLKAIENNIEEGVKSSLQLHLLLRKIASENNITVEDQDLKDELTHQISLIAKGQNQIDFQDKENLQEQLFHLAMDRKVKEFLVNHVTFI